MPTGMARISVRKQKYSASTVVHAMHNNCTSHLQYKDDAKELSFSLVQMAHHVAKVQTWPL